MKIGGIQIGEIALDLVSYSADKTLTLLTRLTVTDDSNIGQSLDLVVLLELECDLLHPSMISALGLHASVELDGPVMNGLR